LLQTVYSVLDAICVDTVYPS